MNRRKEIVKRHDPTHMAPGQFLSSSFTRFFIYESSQHKACSHQQIPRSLDHILSYNKQKTVAGTYLYKPQLSSAAISKQPFYNPNITTRCATYSLITFSLIHTHGHRPLREWETMKVSIEKSGGRKYKTLRSNSSPNQPKWYSREGLKWFNATPAQVALSLSLIKNAWRRNQHDGIKVNSNCHSQIGISLW